MCCFSFKSFQLVWKYYYSPKSSGQHGTLYQLRNLLNRTNVVSDPMDNYNACDDFFVTMIQCHIIAAAIKMLGMEDLRSGDMLTLSRAKPIITVNMLCKIKALRVAGKHS